MNSLGPQMVMLKAAKPNRNPNLYAPLLRDGGAQTKKPASATAMTVAAMKILTSPLQPEHANHFDMDSAKVDFRQIQDARTAKCLINALIGN